jgi:threonylcarbamoyladenosine tRNA methylthiotransferase MtaB
MRYRISSIEPNLLTPDIITLVAHSKKICPHFHIPLQAGSDEVLEQMKRRYDTNYFRKLIHNIKRAMPHAAIGIDVITGFPTETNELFEKGYQFLEELPFSYLHVFSYSKREGTKAASMKNLVPPGEQKKRTHRLCELSDKKQIEFYQTQLGSEHQVIAEHQKGQSYALGWTENYVRVKFPATEVTNELIPIKTIRIEGNVVLGEKILATSSGSSVGATFL